MAIDYESLVKRACKALDCAYPDEMWVRDVNKNPGWIDAGTYGIDIRSPRRSRRQLIVGANFASPQEKGDWLSTELELALAQNGLYRPFINKVKDAYYSDFSAVRNFTQHIVMNGRSQYVSTLLNAVKVLPSYITRVKWRRLTVSEVADELLDLATKFGNNEVTMEVLRYKQDHGMIGSDSDTGIGRL